MSEDKIADVLFNWDHEINPTPLSDMEQNMLHWMWVNDGYNDVRLILSKDELIVEKMCSAVFGRGESVGRGEYPRWVTSLRVELGERFPRERTGRVGHNLPMSLYDLAYFVREAA